MTVKRERYVSDWKPISALRQVETDISSYGYVKEYIADHHLQEKKDYCESNEITGQVCFFEPLEVIQKDGEVLYRENENYVHMNCPESFTTQHGVFHNHNRGEFMSWLGKDDFSEKDKEIHSFFGKNDFIIEGNFCDMFDCGAYSYAISNLMHMGLGSFKIVRIDRVLNATDIYDNQHMEGWNCLEYFGRYKNDLGCVVVVSGYSEPDPNDDGKRSFLDRTMLIQITEGGNCSVIAEWQIQLSSPNSMVRSNHFVFFGQNKMVTRLDTRSGELLYLTNKTEEEMSALKSMW